MVVTDPAMAGVGNVDSYLYQMEQQRGIIDGLQYRVQHGGQYGYHYNPYYANAYGFGDVYGYGGYGAYPGAVLSSTHVAVSDPTATPVSDDAEDTADELSAGEIAGIVIGSVVGLVLLIALLYLCLNSGGRSRRMPPQQQMPQM